ncbi:hypothetical protein GCM10023206_06970 [Acinetobacter puyangensis]|uniref:Uncharacterized protein n=1 Tax=Acinetobacter puyangensis TaxID=1096779 RepID=A0A240E7K2_9GAMM|nr:hypothetical protein [Acinetobacter puyangensis]SNX44223.1 hypothetical protein SAMN05421731_102384 [Acinetobacter puyangensis]
MAYLLFNETGKSVGDVGMKSQCTSAIFNYQVIGSGAVVEFSGSNVPLDQLDIGIEDQWIPICTIESGVADSEPFRQHVWNSLRYKVTAGAEVGIYVTSGVSG